MKDLSSIAPKKHRLMLPPDEHLFVLMCCLLGYNSTEAYLKAIDPTVKRSSAQVLGHHLKNEARIQSAAWRLLRMYDGHTDVWFNASFIKFFGNED